MKSLFLILALYLSVAVVDAQETSLDSLRKLYFEEWVGKCGAEKLVANTEHFDENTSPLFKAYRGAGLATTSNCTSWPLKKISRFRDGKALIEEAVSLKPEDLEVRFLRFTIQRNIPAFLGYDNVEEDRKFIMERLTLYLKKGEHSKLTKLILNYMYDTEELTREQIQDLEALSAEE
jgi:hypothetical protein